MHLAAGACCNVEPPPPTSGLPCSDALLPPPREVRVGSSGATGSEAWAWFWESPRALRVVRVTNTANFRDIGILDIAISSVQEPMLVTKVD
jgi:hypothetical protein